jgi:hypothetical protein
MQTLIITPEQVRLITPVRGSVSNDFIAPAIERAQDLKLAYIIGKNMLTRLQAVVNGGTDTGGVYMNFITTYVEKYLAWATAHFLLPDIAVKIGAAGVEQINSNQGSAVFESTMSLVRQNILSSEDGYKRLMQLHLQYEQNLYPEYITYQMGVQNREDSGIPFHGVQIY